jgi:hypothetical protein
MAKFSSPDAIMSLVKNGMAILEKNMVEEPEKSRQLMESLASKLGQKSIDTNDFSRRLAEAGDMMSKPFSSAIDMQGKSTPTEALGMLHEAILGIEDINARALAAQVETLFSTIHNAFFDADGDEKMTSTTDMRHLISVLQQDELVGAALKIFSHDMIVDVLLSTDMMDGRELASSSSAETTTLLGSMTRGDGVVPRGEDVVSELPPFIQLPILYVLGSILFLVLFAVFPPLWLALPFLIVIIIALFPYVVIFSGWLFVCELLPDLEKCEGKPVGDQDDDFFT